MAAALEDPPGNYLARKTKGIQERTSSVLVGKARSAATSDPDLFATEYSDEYRPREVFEKPVSAAVIRRIQEDGKGRKPFSAPGTQRFNLWKIPSKLVDDELFMKIQQRKQSLNEEKTASTPRLPQIVQLTAAAGGDGSASGAHDKHVGRKPTSHGFHEPPPSSQVTRGRGASEESAGGGGGSGASVVLERPWRDRLDDSRLYVDECANGDLSEMEKEVLALGVEQRLLPAALEYVRNASKSERSIIAKVLQQGARGRGDTLRLDPDDALEPGQLKAVERWLNAANDKEREVARHFFNSILAAEAAGGGASDCGGATSDAGGAQRAKLAALLDRLDRERSTRPRPLRPAAATRGTEVSSAAASVDSVRLRHLRLLSPNTRAARWQHQTWHHLPSYPSKNRTDNISSHYLRTHKPVSLHFTIHPDWGE